MSMRMRGGVARPSGRRGAAKRGTAAAGDEGSDDDGAISLNAIKNKYKPGQQSRQRKAIYSYKQYILIPSKPHLWHSQLLKPLIHLLNSLILLINDHY